MSDWIYGIHAVQALLREDPGRIHRLKTCARGREVEPLAELVGLAKTHGIHIERSDRRTLDRLTDGGNHQSIAAECIAHVAATEREFEHRWPGLDNPLLLVLDGVQDPRNLGACLRTADAAGVDAVLLPKRGGAPLSGTVAKAASGALEHLDVVRVSNLARRLAWLKAQGVWLIGAAEDAAMDHTQVDYRAPVAIVLGGEQKGLRRLTREHCDHLVRIPMLGTVPSLNVSVATGILLYEARGQRARK